MPRVDLLLALPRPKVMRRLWAQLAALGVGRIMLTNAERVERHDFDTHVRLTQNGVHDLCLLGWSADTIDPDNFLSVLLDPENAEPGVARNIAFFKNAELHGLLSWAQESSDRGERERFYRKAQELIAREAPWVPLAYGEVVVAARTNLSALRVNPSGNVFFQPVYRK